MIACEIRSRQLGFVAVSLVVSVFVSVMVVEQRFELVNVAFTLELLWY